MKKGIFYVLSLVNAPREKTFAVAKIHEIRVSEAAGVHLLLQISRIFIRTLILISKKGKGLL